MLLKQFPVKFSLYILHGFHCIHEQTLHHKLHTHVMSADYKQTITENNHTIPGPLNLLLHNIGKIHPDPKGEKCEGKGKGNFVNKKPMLVTLAKCFCLVCLMLLQGAWR